MNRKWKRTDKRSALVVSAMLVAAIFAGCKALTAEEKEAQQNATIERNNEKTELIAIVDGCRIWRVYNENGDDPFFARCPEGAADTFEQHRMSKRQTKTTVTLGDQ